MTVPDAASGPPELEEDSPELVRLMRARPAGLFLDIDGTLAPIIPDVDAVTITSEVRRALGTLATALTVVFLTGRDVTAAQRIVGVEQAIYAGNHGAEWLEAGRRRILPAAEPYVGAVHELAGRAAREFLKLPDIQIEDKGPSLSVHYRRATDPVEARRVVLAFLNGAAVEAGLTIREGKMVAEVRPPVAIDKGTAVRDVVARYGLASAVAIGDDITDIDALLAVAGLREMGGVQGMAIAVVGDDAPPELLAAADATLAGYEAVGRLLVWLAGER